jgi:hypothetical protein
MVPLRFASLFSLEQFLFCWLVFTEESVWYSWRPWNLVFFWSLVWLFFAQTFVNVGFIILNFSIIGPYKINRVPIRRVHQNYVIATSTRLDISKVKIPETIDDAYFRRKREKRAKKAEGDIFAKKKKVFRFFDS